ncbi:hypothetical protein CYMTET_49450 [Cymbomonas tetramitiformis]|uniref:Uncharacterized protein n=1 Tax=Cymbomonas tetramitiformis TaxID=36881 RepID=A0AAE0EVS9_9CHLO|nr:hypothetical protein CYMTET_49450 [Cymbomonas tetramitiformis]
MDKSVRLWHVSMNECLRVFQHNDFVTAIDFHPLNDKFFLSGSLDEKLRLWNIPDHKIADWVHVHEMITAACFSSDGNTVAAGSYKGKCWYYEVRDKKFEYLTQVDVRHTSTSKSAGDKITGMQFLPREPRKLLITSNDSRIRMFDGYKQCTKFKGLKNLNSQIHAQVCSQGDYIICGSEDEHVYIWSTGRSCIPSINPAYTGFRWDKRHCYECFPAHEDIVTAALFAPDSVRLVTPQVLSPDAATGQTRAGHALLNPDAAKKLNQVSDDEAAFEREVAQAAVKAASALGQVIISAGYSGEVRIFENYGMPAWL